MIIQMKQQQVEHALIETAWKHNWDPGREGPTRPIIVEDSEARAIQPCPEGPTKPIIPGGCEPRTDTEAIPQLTQMIRICSWTRSLKLAACSMVHRRLTSVVKLLNYWIAVDFYTTRRLVRQEDASHYPSNYGSTQRKW